MELNVFMHNDKVRILIIEDDALLRRGLARAFSSDGFEVLEFSDGKEAVDSLTDQLPDLILCDYRLPGMNGFGVLNHLREGQRKIPFVLMTAYYSGEMTQEALARGAAAIIEKPIDLAQLKTCCAELVAR